MRLGFENWLFISRSGNYTIMCPSNWLIPGWGDTWDGFKWLCFFREPTKKNSSIFIGELLLYNVVLVSAIQQNESSIRVCVCVCAVMSDSAIPSIDCSPPGSSVHGMSQARILECAAISSYRGSSWSRDWTRVSCVSCTGKRILYHCAAWRATYTYIPSFWISLPFMLPQSIE